MEYKNLKLFCIIAIQHISIRGVKCFISYRYDMLCKYFPHEVFGTNRSTEFFENTLNYLNNPKMLADDLKAAIQLKQPYEVAYLKWVQYHSNI